MTEQTFPRPGAVALITGAGSGIGEATAEALAEIGCRVICTGRRVERVQAVAARLGDNAIATELDVTSDASVDSLPERLPPEWREIDILINNAGHDIGGRRRFDEGTPQQWASIIETNVIGLMRVTHKVMADMIERNHGLVVNIGSVSGFESYAGGTVYAGSKFAVHGFTQSLRKDFADTGIRVCEIMPGMVRTEFALTRYGDDERGKQFYDDFGTSLTPQDIARTVVFAVQQPPHVVISQLVVVPVSQP